MKIGVRSRRSAHGAVSLDMTSMIDATFLLLAYFLFTTSVGGQEGHLLAEVAKARSGENAGSLSPQNIEVESDSEGTLYRIGSRTMRSKEALASVLEQLPHDIGVVVRVHPGPSVGAVAAAMQAAHDAGFAKVSYVTRTK